MTRIIDKTGLWLTDFDGTIKPFDPKTPISPADLAAFKRLKAEGWVLAVVTGRSLFSFALAWEPELELDWLVFSSGAGLCPWSPMGPEAITEAHYFHPQEAEKALKIALDLNFGFFAYLAPPDCHHFYYLAPPARVPAGFNHRLQLFAAQCRPFPPDFFNLAPAHRPALSRLLVMVPESEAAQVKAALGLKAPHLSIISSTSPFDDGCLWLELLPPGISKGRAAAKLAEGLGLDRSRTVAMGNDYNDQDLLDWAGQSFVTRDAPFEILTRHKPIAPAGRGGLAEAVALVLNGPGQ